MIDVYLALTILAGSRDAALVALVDKGLRARHTDGEREATLGEGVTVTDIMLTRQEWKSCVPHFSHWGRELGWLSERRPRARPMIAAPGAARGAAFVISGRLFRPDRADPRP
ncbi:hypothetical protein [Salipiger abyssi]|uniref:hypothetical protein n=1 Tax=Salipiger abyssi TaxID=1250539 RepID=UPI001A90A96E|nr:hypothetical protein [Salipiger abyssi]MBN9887443.1 hypothetical protein [Salipiger abyssi]